MDRPSPSPGRAALRWAAIALVVIGVPALTSGIAAQRTLRSLAAETAPDAARQSLQVARVAALLVESAIHQAESAASAFAHQVKAEFAADAQREDTTRRADLGRPGSGDGVEAALVTTRPAPTAPVRVVPSRNGANVIVRVRTPIASEDGPAIVATARLTIPTPEDVAGPAAIGLFDRRGGDITPLTRGQDAAAAGRWLFGRAQTGSAASGTLQRPAEAGVEAAALAWAEIGETSLVAFAAVPPPPVEPSVLPGVAALLGGAVGLLSTLLLRRMEHERLLEGQLARSRREHDAAIRTLAERQSLETLGRLTANVAHDMGNIMQAVEFYLRSMPAALSDREATIRLIERARQAARRGAVGARDLLALARGSARRPLPTDIAPLLTELADVMQELLGPRFAVRLELQPTLPAALADPGDLEAMLINLATNSRDAMAVAGTGTLTISAALVGSPEDVEFSSDVPGGEWVRIEIADTGVGMDPETLARATEPFFTTKARGRGTGLGLALAREFAERSGGMLRLASLPGSGTRASLFLHPASEARSAVGTDSTTGEPGPGSATDQGPRIEGTNAPG